MRNTQPSTIAIYITLNELRSYYVKAKNKLISTNMKIYHWQIYKRAQINQIIKCVSDTNGR